MSGRFFRRVQNFFGRNEGQPQQGATNPGRNNNGDTIHEEIPMDLEQLLQTVFGSVQDSFDAATRAAMEASLRDTQHPQGPPPASARAVRDLPLIRIRAEDLVDPVNRECCVCLEPHKLGETAVRLPCAHIFHKECIGDWLKSHCTCPVCRYELPTDDPNFERQRLERMRHRKPRFALHELERLSIKELKRLLPAGDKYRAIDRADLIDHLISEGAIDLIASPEPVEYSMVALRQMTISQLKRCMNEEGGVFFDPKDVVEKEDMIRIFLSSGRLRLLPEDTENDESTSAASSLTGTSHQSSTLSDSAGIASQPVVETVAESERKPSPQPDLRTNKDLVMEECSPEDVGNTAGASITANSPQLEEEATNHDHNATETPMDESIRSHSSLLAENEASATMKDDSATVEAADSAKISESGINEHTETPAENNCTLEAKREDMEVESNKKVGQDDACTSNHSNRSEEEDQIDLSENQSSATQEQKTMEVDGTEKVGENDASTGTHKRQSDEEAKGDLNMHESHGISVAEELPARSVSMTSERTISSSLTSDTQRIDGTADELPDSMLGDDSVRSAGDTLDPASPAEFKATTETHRPSRKRSYPNIAGLSSDPPISPFDRMSVSELRRRGDQMSVDLSGCLERQEMINKLSRHSIECERACSDLFADLSASELLMLASLVDVKNLRNGDRHSLETSLLEEVKERPHIASFVKSLAPFVCLSVPQLRSVARERGVDVRDCLEKTDILRRLVETKGR